MDQLFWEPGALCLINPNFGDGGTMAPKAPVLPSLGLLYISGAGRSDRFRRMDEIYELKHELKL